MNTQTVRSQQFDAFHARMNELRARSKKLADSIIDEARKAAQEAGLSPEMPFLHAHNALCSFEYGQPWEGVNYSLVRKVKWLEQKSWEPSRIYDAIWKREYNKLLDTLGETMPRYADAADDTETL